MREGFDRLIYHKSSSALWPPEDEMTPASRLRPDFDDFCDAIGGYGFSILIGRRDRREQDCMLTSHVAAGRTHGPHLKHWMAGAERTPSSRLLSVNFDAWTVRDMNAHVEVMQRLVPLIHCGHDDQESLVHDDRIVAYQKLDAERIDLYGCVDRRLARIAG
jgi:hypothetical protein